MMISRFIKCKGIENYIYLAKFIKDKYKNIDFILIGKRQKNFLFRKGIVDKVRLKKYIKVIKIGKRNQ